MALLICFVGVMVPFEIAFEKTMIVEMGEAGWRGWEVFNLIVDFIFILDVAFNFRTAVFIEGQLVKNASQIASHYMRSGNLFIDIVGSFPINLIISAFNDSESSTIGGSAETRLNRQLRLLRIIKINRLLRLSKLKKRLTSLRYLLSFNPSAIRMFTLMVLMVCCCHWMGCLWWLVSDLELSYTDAPTISQNAWQPPTAILRDSLSNQFAASFFWGAGMVTAMLPYDVEPATEWEVYATTLCMFVGLMLNAFVIGSMTSALSTMDSKQAVSRGKIETINAYLRIHNVPHEIRVHILEFYEYLYTSSQSMEDLRLFHDLPPSLATQLAITVHRRSLARAPFFNALSDAALLGVLSRLRPLIYVPGQVVMIEGQLIKAVNLIKKGQVALLRNMGSTHEEEVRIVGQHESFGLDIESLHQAERALEERHSTQAGGRSSRASAGVKHASADGDANHLLRLHAMESARAIMYCDVVELRMADLAEILEQDLARRAAQSANPQEDSWGARVGVHSKWSKVRNADLRDVPSTAPAAAPLKTLSSGDSFRNTLSC